MRNLITLLLIIGITNQVQSQVFTESDLPIVVITTPGGVPIVDDPRITAHMGVIDNGPGVTNYLTDPYTNYNADISIEN